MAPTPLILTTRGHLLLIACKQAKSRSLMLCSDDTTNFNRMGYQSLCQNFDQCLDLILVVEMIWFIIYFQEHLSNLNSPFYIMSELPAGRILGANKYGKLPSNEISTLERFPASSPMQICLPAQNSNVPRMTEQ